MVEIRAAVLADIPEIVKLAKEAHATSRYSSFSHLDVETVKAMSIESIAQNKTGRGAFLVADNGEGLEGCFLGTVTPLYAMLDVMVASNQFFYTAETSRVTTALRLIRTFMRWAGQTDKKLIYRLWMTDAMGNLEQLDRMMISLGFHLSGGTYDKENF